MKATGVIRRIDDLGRIVIPKEIRKNLKMNEGDSLEIYVLDDDVVLRKYSLLDKFNNYTKRIVDVYYKCFNKSIIVTDKDKIIASSKDVDDYSNKMIISNIKNHIIDRKEDVITCESIVNDMEKVPKLYILPIIIDSDAIGSIVLISDDISDYDIGVIKLIKEILIKNIEE